MAELSFVLPFGGHLANTRCAAIEDWPHLCDSQPFADDVDGASGVVGLLGGKVC